MAGLIAVVEGSALQQVKTRVTEQLAVVLARRAGVALLALAGSGGRSAGRLRPETPSLFCVASVALGNICRRLVWQAWHSVTSAFTLSGKRGTHGWAGSEGGFGRCWGPVRMRLVCVASVALGRRALGDICLYFVWQAWHLRHGAGVGGGFGSCRRPVRSRLLCVAAWHLATCTFVNFVRRGTR
eukprot:s5014_g9.t1